MIASDSCKAIMPRESAPRAAPTYPSNAHMIIAPERLASAMDFPTYLSTVQESADLWSAVYRTVRVPEGAVERARQIPGRWHLLALSEDWCGDAVNALPLLARLTEQVPSFDLRLLGRDANPDLMDRHLTGSSRSIPVVMVLDDQLVEHGWWGPRPGPLQAWFQGEGQALEKKERYRQMRQWYARDRGATILDEVLTIAERGALALRP
jgi:hypothetical protein